MHEAASEQRRGTELGIGYWSSEFKVNVQRTACNYKFLQPSSSMYPEAGKVVLEILPLIPTVVLFRLPTTRSLGRV